MITKRIGARRFRSTGRVVKYEAYYNEYGQLVLASYFSALTDSEIRELYEKRKGAVIGDFNGADDFIPIPPFEEGKWYSVIVDSLGNLVITDRGMEKALELFEKLTGLRKEEIK